MKIAYFDCIGGASGDMILGALIDSGVPLSFLEEKFHKLPIYGWDIKVKKVVKGGIAATSVGVVIKKQTKLRNLKIIESLLKKSSLPKEEIEDAIGIFRHLGAAEAKVHGTSLKKVHFHEIGAIDTIIDIVGAVCGLKYLEIKKVFVSDFPVAHIGPAALELLKGYPVFGVDEQKETVTPTGMAILTSVTSFRAMMSVVPPCTITSIGYGAGKSDFKTRQNVLRLVVGESIEVYETSNKNGFHHEQLVLLETNIDDTNPQIYDYVMERLFKEGALDVWLTPIHMKKNRPATTLSILCKISDERKFSGIVFKEGLTLGIRRQSVDRFSLPREIKTVKTKYGNIRVKIAKFNGIIVRAMPEYEDCKRVAMEKMISLQRIMEEVKKIAKN